MINLDRISLTADERIAARNDLTTTLIKAGGHVENEAKQLSSILLPDLARANEVVWHVNDDNHAVGWVLTRRSENKHLSIVAAKLPLEIVRKTAEALLRQAAIEKDISLDYVVSRGDKAADEFHDVLQGKLTSVNMAVEVVDIPLATQVELRRMDVTRFDNFLQESIDGHAADLFASGTVSDLELARTESRRQTEQLLAQGVDTPGHSVWSAYHGDDEVGTLWIQRREHRVFIYRIEVDPAHRRRGYGGQILRAAAAETREAGLKWLSLNVFGNNVAAQALYRQEGYEATQQNFSRLLFDLPDATVLRTGLV